MAESPLDRLKRLAAEKAKVVQPVPVAQAETASAEGGASVPVTEEPSVGIVETKLAVLSMQLAVVDQEVKKELAAEVIPEPTASTSNHPLAMEFAELEAALLSNQPEFKTILRQIHRHLGQEPELVTQMTEEEIRVIVSGMIVFANAEIVAPAAAKTAKAKIAAAKKQVISADDL